MTDSTIYLEVSDAVELILSENQITVDDILTSKNIDAKVTYGVLPFQLEEGVRGKKIVPIIISSSAAVLSIGFAVSTILTTIYNKPYLVEFNEIQEVRDKEGNPILDKEGNPVFKTLKRIELLEPRKEDIDRELEVGFDDTNKIYIKIKSFEDQE